MKTILATLLCAACCVLASCGRYTADDYIGDLRELTEKAVKNAPSYTKEDWEQVAEDFRRLNEKGAEACKDLTDEQAREIGKLKKELRKKAAAIDGKTLKNALEDLTKQADEALKDLFED